MKDYLTDGMLMLYPLIGRQVNNMSDEWIRMTEAAKIYGCGRQWIYQLVDEGRLNTIMMFGLKLVNKSDVERLRDEVKPRGLSKRLK